MKRTNTGFSLMELMVAITVLGILLGFAVPSFREFTRSNRVTAVHNDLTTAFTVARSEALKRSQPVSICASTDGESCATNEDWSGGWIVFTDATGTAGEVNDDDVVLQTWTTAAGGDVNIGTEADFIQYGASGSVIPDSASTFDVLSSVCKGQNVRRLGVSPTGALTASTQNCT